MRYYWYAVLYPTKIFMDNIRFWSLTCLGDMVKYLDLKLTLVASCCHSSARSMAPPPGAGPIRCWPLCWPLATVQPWYRWNAVPGCLWYKLISTKQVPKILGHGLKRYGIVFRVLYIRGFLSCLSLTTILQASCACSMPWQKRRLCPWLKGNIAPTRVNCTHSSELLGAKAAPRKPS